MMKSEGNVFKKIHSIAYRGIDDVVSEFGKDFFKKDLEFYMYTDFLNIDAILECLNYESPSKSDRPLGRDESRTYKATTKKEKEVYAEVFGVSEAKLEQVFGLNKLDYFLRGTDETLYLLKFKNPELSDKLKRRINTINAQIILDTIKEFDISSIVTNSDHEYLITTGDFEEYGYGKVERGGNPSSDRWSVVVEEVPIQKEITIPTYKVVVEKTKN